MGGEFTSGGSIMADAHLAYDPTAAHRLLKQDTLRELEPDLLSARKEVFDDVDLLRSGGEIPQVKQPLDSGFIDFPQRAMDEYAADRSGSLLGGILGTAEMLRAELDGVVSLGIGGSYMGARALFEALCRPFHNELPRELRNGVPRIYFEGNNVDNDALHGLLQLLTTAFKNPADAAGRWGIVVISKSGGTLETAAAFRLFRQALEAFYGDDRDAIRKYIVPITGASGKLHDLSANQRYVSEFPVPDGIGGRFSVLTAVGLLPAAVMGLDVVKLLEGAVAATENFRRRPFGENPVLDYTATCRLFEEEHGMTIRVLSTWGSRLEALGLWYDQLLSESLGKAEQGATPITVVNSRDLHSRGQQHQEGRRDKLITNLIVDSPSTDPIPLPEFPGNEDDLNQHAGKTVPELLRAAIAGTNQAYADDRRPTADIHVPVLNEFAMGELFQFFMLATALEGRLIGINPYGQPGVEAYKRNMKAVLKA
jgi:glucose-6-phosphate isomerase